MKIKFEILFYDLWLEMFVNFIKIEQIHYPATYKIEIILSSLPRHNFYIFNITTIFLKNKKNLKIDCTCANI